MFETGVEHAYKDSGYLKSLFFFSFFVREEKEEEKKE